MNIRWWVYQDQAGSGDGQGATSGGGGAAGADGAGAGSQGAAGAGSGGSGTAGGSPGAAGAAGGGAGQTGAAAGGSLLADAASTAGTGASGAASGGNGGAAAAGGLTPDQKALDAAEKDTRRPQHVPAKYWDSEKGAIRDEAAFKSLTELETRMRATGLPPKSAEEYKFEIPDALKAAGIELDQTTSNAFRTAAHELGLTQKQYEGVMGAYFQNMESIALGGVQYGREKLSADLLAHYKTPEATQESVALAFKVVQAFGDDDEKAAALGPMGNTPPWVYRVLAKVGKELGEDRPVNPDQALGGDSIEHLMRGMEGKEDSPYWNKDDPRHAATVAKVKAYHEAKAAANRRQGA